MSPNPVIDPQPHQGMRTFVLMWLGSTVSMLGSALTGFVLGVWAFRETGSATLYSLIAVAGMVPSILLSPVAGALADRWDRRLTMVWCTVVAILVTSVITFLLVTGRLEVWHLYLTATVMSLVVALERPASMGATTVLIPPRHFARASGMMQFGGASIRIVAPVLAGILLGVMHEAGVLLIDLVSFVAVLGVLLAIRIPPPPARPAGAPPRPALWRDAATGWRYIRARPGIFGLLVYFATIGIAPTVSMVLLTPLVLRFADTQVLGSVMSVAGLGALTGGLLMSTWGGPRRRFHGIIGAGVILGVSVIVAGVRMDPRWIAAGAFGIMMGGPIMTTSFNALWQVKTPLELHGRVFATILMIAESSAPLALLAAGPATDYFLEPLMRPGGALAGTFGPVLGVGEGRGIGLLYVFLGVFVLGVTAVASRLPRLRFAEDELADAVAPPAPAGQEPAAPVPAAAGAEPAPSM
ncbi:MAG TPA: MFS transporter [Longimicrobiaceae bacterium]|nr:MFS transporter [Longimicrobiaceae bacterium]